MKACYTGWTWIDVYKRQIQVHDQHLQQRAPGTHQNAVKGAVAQQPDVYKRQILYKPLVVKRKKPDFPPCTVLQRFQRLYSGADQHPHALSPKTEKDIKFAPACFTNLRAHGIFIGMAAKNVGFCCAACIQFRFRNAEGSEKHDLF